MADVRREMERLRPVYETGVLRLLLRGNSMLYNLTDLLRNTREDQVNFARCAYLLARLRPDEKKASPAQQDAYRTFSHNVLDWARDPEQRRQLITAIYIYVYQKRGRE